MTPLQLAQGVEAGTLGRTASAAEVVLDHYDLVFPVASGLFRYRIVCKCKNYSGFV